VEDRRLKSAEEVKSMSASKFKRAQGTAEYVIVLGLVIGAVIAMQTYLKRGLQSRVKEATDYTYNPGNDSGMSYSTNMSIFNGSVQYEPYYLRSDFASTRQGETTTDLFNAGSAEGEGAYNKTTMSDVTTRTGNQTLELANPSWEAATHD
jgi:hypothetical protein